MATPTIDWERLARAKTHPIQVSILELLTIDTGRAMSPNEMAFEMQEPLGNLSYHATQLAEIGFLELTATEPRRGALEHFYRMTPAIEGAVG
ncbi:MAG TPA: helix-turn-helix domain-containing protein [Solirubrobacterales bacterium]|nr:helix-turn-helix domain-containing protein [Solirubrobacterales bacterium]